MIKLTKNQQKILNELNKEYKVKVDRDFKLLRKLYKNGFFADLTVNDLIAIVLVNREIDLDTRIMVIDALQRDDRRARIRQRRRLKLKRK